MQDNRSAFLTGASGFIGTNLATALLRSGWRVTNYDTAGPLNPAHVPIHRRGDILDSPSLSQAMKECQPDVVIHLAARTDCDQSTTLEAGYAANTHGTRNVLDAIKRTASVRRALVTSSQYVCGPGRLPKSAEDYFPHTIYGESKVITERMTRAASLTCSWALIRPVNTWGPYHMRYAREFWNVVKKGWYLHPGLPSPVRCYGYVGNVTWQIQRILELPDAFVSGKVFYVGDRPKSIDHWIYGFHRAIRGKDPRVIPAPLMRCLAAFGDVISFVTKRPFYITSSRLRSMTQDYAVNIEETFRVLGEAPWSLEQGIKQTINWLESSIWKH